MFSISFYESCNRTCCAANFFSPQIDLQMFHFSVFAITLAGEACKRQTGTLPHIIQICKCEWKCAGCCVLQLCLYLSVQIENIDACLSFLAAKGVNIQGLSAEGKLDSCISLLSLKQNRGRSELTVSQVRPGLATKQMSFILREKKNINGNLI